MSYFPDFVRNEIVPGVTGVDLDWSNVDASGLLRVMPQLMVFDRNQARQQGLTKVKNSYGKSFAGKGVYILFDSQPKPSKRYYVRVGLSGFDGEKTLFDRLKDHSSNPPNKMHSWDKAVAICDWKEDIPTEIIAETIDKKKEIKKKNSNMIEDRMEEEAKFLEKKLLEIVNKIPTLTSKGKDHRNAFIVNPDTVRNNLYIFYILRLLKSQIDFTEKSATMRFGNKSTGIENLMAKGKLAINEKLSGKFESKATVINFDGTLCVEKYKENDSLVTDSTDTRLKAISANQASNIILQENGQATTMSAMEFWTVERHNDTIKLSNL